MSVSTSATERTSVTDTQLSWLSVSATRIDAARAASISATTTRAPRAAKALAIARPMPAPPPVTSAVLPARVNAETVSFISRIRGRGPYGYSNQGRSTRAQGDAMTQVAIGLYGLQGWFGGDFAPVTELVRKAES